MFTDDGKVALGLVAYDRCLHIDVALWYFRDTAGLETTCLFW